MVTPDAGTVRIDEEEVTNDPMYIRARKGIGYLPQETSVFRKLSVRDNLMAILETLPLSRDEMNQQADMLLGELGIAHLAKQKAA